MNRTYVGRVLGLLRRAAGLSREDVAIAIDARPRRVRDLEAGYAELGYLEALGLAKVLGVCPNCFRRWFESARARDGAVLEPDPAQSGES